MNMDGDLEGLMAGYQAGDFAAARSLIDRLSPQLHRFFDAQARNPADADDLLQDAAVLNVIRACETAIDLANMVIRKKRLGIPAESRDSFGILVRESILQRELGDKLQKMVGFRNLAVHRYRDLDMDIVEAVIQRSLDDLLTFAKIAQSHLN